MAKKASRGSTKNKVTTGIVGEAESFDLNPKSMKDESDKRKKKLKEMKKEPMADDLTHPAWIISRLPQAVTLSYGGEAIMVPARTPKGKLFVRNSRMLGKLPKGVQVLPAPEKMAKKDS